MGPSRGVGSHVIVGSQGHFLANLDMGCIHSDGNRAYADPGASRDRQSSVMDMLLRRRTLATTKVLLLGPAQAGKTTVVKQIRHLMGEHDYSSDQYAELLHRQVIKTTVQVLATVLREQQHIVTPDLQLNYMEMQAVMQTQDRELLQRAVQKACQMWDIPVLSSVVNHPEAFGLPENSR